MTEASYEPRQIPNAGKEMEGSVILRPTREQWLSMLGEMVQMVNEAVRRRAASIRDASKPLSLEYMADRLDVDDPLFGYMVVTADGGWLQGYIPRPPLFWLGRLHPPYLEPPSTPKKNGRQKKVAKKNVDGS